MKALNKKAKILGISMAVAGMFAMSSAAQAAPITGQVNFTGGVYGVSDLAHKATTRVTDWANAKALDFTTSLPTAAAVKQFLNQGISQTGTYDPLNSPVGNGRVTFKDFAFNPGLSPNPVNPLWTITDNSVTYSFVMNSVSVKSQGSSFLVLKGLGTLSVTGYDDTNGSFNFSASGFANTNFKFGFSGGALPTPIPAALFFVAPALLGAFGVSRRKNAAGLAA